MLTSNLPVRLPVRLPESVRCEWYPSLRVMFTYKTVNFTVLVSWSVLARETVVWAEAGYAAPPSMAVGQVIR